MNRDLEPSPDFVEKLEWQVRTALQRQTRWSEPVRPGNGGTMKLAIVILVSALLGAGGVVVKDEVQEAKAQELLLARVEMEIQLAELQVEMVRADVDQVEERVAGGVEEDEALIAARVALRTAMTHLDRLQLDREEIRITGEEPRNDVSAPLVRGRDFVTERLDLESRVAEGHLELVAYELSRVRARQAAGLMQAGEEGGHAAAAVQQVQMRLEALEERRRLRRQVLAGEVTADEAENREAIVEATAELEQQNYGMEMAVRMLHALEERAAQGLVHESEVRRARLQVRQQELALKFAELKLQQLRGGRDGER